MPTYDYHCQDCGPMEIFQSIKDDALKRCPQCGSRKFQKCVSSGAGIIFKGDGFWETDYNRSQQYQQQSKAERNDTSSSGDAGASQSPAAASKGDAASSATTAPSSPSSSSSSGPSS